MKIFITGRPSIEKSTVLERTVSRKRKLGYSVGGITSPEVSVSGKRTGFDVINVASGERAVLVRVNEDSEHSYPSSTYNYT